MATLVPDKIQIKNNPTNKVIDDTQVDITPNYAGNLAGVSNQKEVNDVLDAFTGGGGHTIQGPDGTPVAQESVLEFRGGLEVVAESGKTVVRGDIPTIIVGAASTITLTQADSGKSYDLASYNSVAYITADLADGTYFYFSGFGSIDPLSAVEQIQNWGGTLFPAGRQYSLSGYPESVYTAAEGKGTGGGFALKKTGNIWRRQGFHHILEHAGVGSAVSYNAGANGSTASYELVKCNDSRLLVAPGHTLQGPEGIPVAQESVLEFRGMSVEPGTGKTIVKTGYVSLQSYIPVDLLPAINNFTSLVNIDAYIDDCIASLDTIGAKLFIPPGQYCTSGGLVKTTTRGDLGRGFLFDTFWHLTVDADGAIIICDPTIPPLTRTTFSGRAAIEANCFGLEFHNCRHVTWTGVTLDGNAPNLHVDAYASTAIAFDCYKLVFNRYTRKNDKHQTSFRGTCEYCGINGLTDIEGNDYDSHIKKWIGFREPGGITDGIMDTDPTPDITVYAESFGGDTHDHGGFKFFIEVEAGGTTYKWGRQAFTTDKLIIIRTTAAHGKSVNDAITVTGLDAAVNGSRIVCQVIDTTHLAYLVSSGPSSVTDQGGAITEGTLIIDQVTLEDGIVWVNGVAFHTTALKLVNPLTAERLAYDPPLEMPIIQWASDGAHTAGATYGFMHIDAQISGIGFGDPDFVGVYRAHDNFLKNAEIRSGGGAFSWAYGQKDITLDTCVWGPPAWWGDLPGGQPANHLYGNQYGTFWAGSVDGLKVIDSDIQIDGGDIDNVTLQNVKCRGIISFVSSSTRTLKNYKINGLHFYDVFNGPGPQAGWGGDADYAASTIAGWADHCLIFAGAQGNTYGFDGLQISDVSIGGAAGTYVMASLLGTCTFGKNTNQVVPLTNVQIGNIQAPTTHCLLSMSEAFQAFVPDAIDTTQSLSITINPIETASNITSYAGRFRNFDYDGQASSYGLIGLIKNRGVTASPSGTKVGTQGTAVKDTDSNTGTMIALAGAVTCSTAATSDGSIVVTTGTILDARAISSTVSLVAGVTATKSYGVYASANEGGGAIGTAYSAYFGNTGGAIIYNYGVYCNSTGNNYLRGNVLSNGYGEFMGNVYIGGPTGAELSYYGGILSCDYVHAAPGFQGPSNAPAPLPYGAKFADDSIQTTANRVVINRGNQDVVLTVAEALKNPLVIVPTGYTCSMANTDQVRGMSCECYGAGTFVQATGGAAQFYNTLGEAVSAPFSMTWGLRVSVIDPGAVKSFLVEPLANTAHTHTAAQIGVLINGADAVTTPGDTDRFALSISSVLKYVTWVNIKATLKTYFDTVYATGPSSVTTDTVSAFDGTTGKLIKACVTTKTALDGFFARTPSNVLAARALGTVYQNTTGREVVLHALVTSDYTSGIFRCRVTAGTTSSPTVNYWLGDDANNGASANSSNSTIHAYIPAGWYYKLTVNQGTGTANVWTEM